MSDHLGRLVCRLRLRLAALIVPSGWGLIPTDWSTDEEYPEGSGPYGF